MPPRADEDLLAEFCRGSMDAFDELYKRYQGPTFGFLLRLLRDRGIAEDVFQDLWLQVVEQAPSFRAGGKVRTWLFMIARSRAYDRMRRAAVRRGSRAEPRRAVARGGQENGGLEYVGLEYGGPEYRDLEHSSLGIAGAENGAAANPDDAPGAYPSHDGAEYDAVFDDGTADRVMDRAAMRTAGTSAGGRDPQSDSDAAAAGREWAGEEFGQMEDDGPLAARLQAERRHLLDRVLAVLPEEQRLVFLLREEGELSLSEVAETLGVPYETAKSRYRYALARLRAQFSVAARRLT